MSYEPSLLIKFSDLKRIEKELVEEQYSDNTDVERIANFLLEDLKHENLLPEFEGTKVVLTKPEFTSFNSLVRERLDEGNVYYVTFI